MTSTPAPDAASTRAASQCSAARTGAGVCSYRTVRIRPCRKAIRSAVATSAPAAIASFTTSASSVADRPLTVPRSATAGSGPSRAAIRSVARAGSDR